MKHVRCPLCRADNTELKFPATEFEQVVGTNVQFRCTSPTLAQHGLIVRCLECGMIYASPQLEVGDLIHAYREVQDPEYLQQRRSREILFTGLLSEVQRFIEPPGRLLDIGCYTGIFLETAAEAGWNVEGIEPSDWASGIARQAGPWVVQNCSLQDADLVSGTYDVISMWDVIEHLPLPCEALDRCAQALRPGGILALSTHFLDSLVARLMGTRYPFLMDMHPVHFTRRTMRLALANAGFEVLSVNWHWRTVMLDYLLERLSLVIPFSSPVFRLLLRLPTVRDRSVTVGGVGLFNVFARRRG